MSHIMGDSEFLTFILGMVLNLMQTSSLHRETAIFFGVKHSYGHKTQEVVKTRVFQEAPWLIYGAGVNSSPPLGSVLNFDANIQSPT